MLPLPPLRAPAGEQGGRPTWTWSAPLFLTVTAAGLGLTVGYTEIGAPCPRARPRPLAGGTACLARPPASTCQRCAPPPAVPLLPCCRLCPALARGLRSMLGPRRRRRASVAWPAPTAYRPADSTPLSIVGVCLTTHPGPPPRCPSESIIVLDTPEAVQGFTKSQWSVDTDITGGWVGGGGWVGAGSALVVVSVCMWWVQSVMGRDADPGGGWPWEPPKLTASAARKVLAQVPWLSQTPCSRAVCMPPQGCALRQPPAARATHISC